ncbi:hypothetical protein QQ045_013431 [Rhodiola kirilowii]
MNKPWVLVGDFNTISSWSKKRGGNRMAGNSIRDFNDFMANVGVSDAGYSGSPFTWSNNQSGTSRIWLRLDRALLNGRAMAAFQQLQVTHLPRVSSDHCPLLVAFNGAKNNVGRSFKFMGVWTEHKDFFDVVKKDWQRNDHPNPLINIAIKLKQTRSDLKNWNWECFGNVTKQISRVTKEIEELESQLQGGWDSNLNTMLGNSKSDLATLLRYQHNILEEKARVNWLQSGERNTSLFHVSIKARRIQNPIRLQLDDGSYTEDPDIIGTKASIHFQNQFGDFPNSGLL